MGDNEHTLEECPQAPMIENMSNAIIRMERVSERTAVALEQIAAQGAMVQSHEKRLDKHDVDFREIFTRIRPIEERHAQDVVRDTASGEQKKFWTDVKKQMIQPVIVGIFFVLWIFDRINAFQWAAKMWKAMGGE